MKSILGSLTTQLVLFILALLVFVSVAEAQSTDVSPPVITPLRVASDRNGVNLVDGRIRIELPSLSVPAAPRLFFSRLQDVLPYVVGSIPAGDPDTTPSNFSFSTGRATSDSIRCLADVCASLSGTGSFYAEPYYTQSGGARYTFNLQSYDISNAQGRSFLYYASSVLYPDGETITYTYQTSVQGTRTYYRPTTISSSVGYAISVTYQSNTYGTLWAKPLVAMLYASAAPTVALAKLTYSADSMTITDIGNRVFSCTGCSNGSGTDVETWAGSLQLPGESISTKVVTALPTTPVVGGVNQDGVNWSYGYTGLVLNPSGQGYHYDKITVTGPDTLSDQYFITYFTQNPKRGNYINKWTDTLNRSTLYQYDSGNRLSGIVYPEGNSVNLVYDAYGNIVQKTSFPKAGSGLSNLVESAYVDVATCAGGVNCWRPVWTRDALNRQTDYVYNGAGQVTEQTDPADAAGVRRKTYVTYTTTGLSRRSVVRLCGNTTTCGTSSEIRTEYDYWGNTALPSVERRIDAVRGITLTTAYAYDGAGRVTSIDGPMPGTDDTRYFRYDVYGRRTWEVGARSPAGLYLATRTTYRDSDDKVTAVETGWISTPTSTTLSVSARTDTTYDSRRYAVRQSMSSNGTTYSLADKSFSDRGWLLCATVRMNLATPLTDACTGGGTAPNQDRITKNIYDNAGQPIQMKAAFGTSVESTDMTASYTLNGKRDYVIDANGNRARLVYDGFDRQSQWVFPSTTRPTSFNPATQATALATAGALNAGDYEQYGYDAVGNRLSLRKRDGSILTYQYDGLNRVKLKIVPERPGLPPTYTRDVYYSYDIEGHQLTARFDSASGEGVTTTWDLLGRQLSATLAMDGASRALSYQYDADSNRTLLTFPDGNAVTYNYDALDRPTSITRPNQTIASYGYDSTGRRTSFTGELATSYTYYDGTTRLATLSNTLPATVTNSYGFQYNPAGQITQVTRSNNAFVYSGLYNVSRSYTANGLNQYLAAGSAAFSYDVNGNLIGDAATTFTYDVENRLVTASGAKTGAMRYDPLGRLYETSGGLSGTTRFLYDGDMLVAEYDSSGTLLRRYVHGADATADDPIAWYEGGGFNATSERFLRPDWQGSIVLVSDSAGEAVLAINRYDEYGIPQANAGGRFRYTGQAWLPDLGVYHYKARIYSPTMGRFLQTDPIGYQDQFNLYAYVRNDPINKTDPTGFYECSGNNAQCGAVEKAYNRAVDALKSNDLTKSERTKIQTAVNALGTPGLKNGVTVAFAAPKDISSKVGNAFAYTEKTKGGEKVVLPNNYAKSFDSWKNNPASPVASKGGRFSPEDARANALAHEGKHVDQFRNGMTQEQYNRNPSPYETDAYRTGNAVNEAFGSTSPFPEP